MYSESGKYRERNPAKRIMYEAMSKVPISAVHKHFEKYIRRRNKKRTGWVRILTFPTPNREYGYRRRWYEDMSDITFEGEVFTSVRDYEEYLTFKFGNYLELPPKEEQKIHHRISEFKIPEETEVRE